MSIYLSKTLFDQLQPGDMFEGETLMPGLSNEPTVFVMEKVQDNGNKLFGMYWYDLRLATAEARSKRGDGEIEWGYWQ